MDTARISNPISQGPRILYARVAEFTEDFTGDSYPQIELDLLDDNLAKADEQLQGLTSLPEDYRPFFFGLTVDDYSEEGLKLLNELRGGDWFEINIEPIASLLDSQKYLAICTVTFSASPIESLICGITGIGPTKKSCPNFTVPSSAYCKNDYRRASGIIKWCCRSIQKEGPISNILIPHIGQGLQTRITLSSGNFFCFDIGYSRSGKTDRTINESIIVNDFTNLRFVVLSHWDTDHILGAYNSSTPKAINVPWIGPSMINSHNAKRLALAIYLRNNSNLLLIDYLPTFALKKSKCGCEISVFKINGATINDSGLGLLIEMNKKILIIGDAGYDLIPTQCTTDLDVLVVSHHGAEVSGNIPTPRTPSESLAIITTGKNTFLHPKTNTLKAVRTLGYSIHRTDYDGAICFAV